MKVSTKQEIVNIISKSDVLETRYEIVKKTASASSKKSALDQIVKSTTSAISDQRDVIVAIIKIR